MWTELLVTFNRTDAESPLEAQASVEKRLGKDRTFYIPAQGMYIGRFYDPVCDAFEVGGISSGRLSAARLSLDFYGIASRMLNMGIKDQPREPIHEDIYEEVETEPYDPKKQRALIIATHNRYQRLWRVLGGTGLSPYTRYSPSLPFSPGELNFNINDKEEGYEFSQEELDNAERDFEENTPDGFDDPDRFFEDDAQIVDEVLYERLLKRYEGESEVEDGGILTYADLDREYVSREFIGNKWLAVLGYHF